MIAAAEQLEILPRLYPLPTHWQDAAQPLDIMPDPDDFELSPRADRALKIFGLLRISEGIHAGKSVADVMLPWQKRLVRLLYGLETEAGERQIQTVSLLMARKSAKSSTAAFLMLTEILMSDEQAGQFLILSGSRDQSKIAFNCAANAIRAAPPLLERFEIREYRTEIYYRPTNSILKIVSGTGASIYGSNPSCAIVDEVHILGQMRKGQALVSAVTTGQVARKNPLVIFISTSPDGFESGIFSQVYGKARAVRDGVLDDRRMLHYLGELPAGAILENSDRWSIPNPSIGVTVTLERLESEYSKNADDPVAMASWASQHLNLCSDQAGTASGALTNWIRKSRWQQCTNDDGPWDWPDIIDGASTLVAGLDAGGAADHTALVIMGEHDSIWRVMCRQWLSRKTYMDQNFIGPDIRRFVELGLLSLYDDDDCAADIVAILKQAHATGKLLGVGTDAYAAGVGVHRAIEKEKLGLIATPRGYKLAPAIGHVESLIVNGKLEHDGDEQLAWNVAGVQVKEQTNGRQLQKTNATSLHRIDGVMAMLSAAAVLLDDTLQKKPLNVKTVVF